MSDNRKIALWATLALIAIAIFGITSARPVPAHTWIGIGGAMVVGVLALVLSYRLGSQRRLVKDLIRDIGIAFIVAVIVSVVYEFSTRSIGEHDTILQVINSTMSSFVPPSVWGEVTNEIIQRKAIRRNVQIDLELTREVVLPNGQVVPAPKGQAVLWMSYSYDLYGMSDKESQINVQHELEYEMRNEQLQLPRFLSVTVSGPSEHQVRTYQGDELKDIYDGKGSVKLDGARAVSVPPDGSTNSVRITTVRYELLNAPGSYDLIVPELTARDEKSKNPTIKIALRKIPDDLQVDIDTYYAAHSFTRPDPNKNMWTFDRSMLPGQGLTLVIKPRSSGPSVSAIETK